jgi:hypothetical protein
VILVSDVLGGVADVQVETSHPELGLADIEVQVRIVISILAVAA